MVIVKLGNDLKALNEADGGGSGRNSDENGNRCRRIVDDDNITHAAGMGVPKAFLCVCVVAIYLHC